ncbi:Vps5 C terminal like-domain-containing protein [Paraphysoderma sedebokerense]|nr:Vps5 C terminal like-domain-containing protein [Paraphysoderma sedebokerense]
MDLYAPLAYAKSLDPSTISAAPPVPPLALPHDQPYLGPPKPPGSDIPNSSVPNQEEPAQTSEKHSGAQELPKSESVWDKLYDFDVKLIDVVSSGPDALYRFSITTNLSEYRQQSATAERSHEDFARLHSYYLKSYPDCIIPVLPPSRTTVINPDQESKKTSVAISEWLKAIAGHPVLVRDEGTILFFTDKNAFYPPAKSSTHTNPNWGSKFKALVSITPRDVDLSYENAKRDVTELESELLAMRKNMEKVVKCRKALAASYIDLSTKLTTFGSAELNQQLANIYNKVGKRLQYAAEINVNHADAEYSTVIDFSNDCINSCQAVQSAFNHRLRVLTLYDSACRATEKQNRKMEKMKGSSSLRQEKVNNALEKHDELLNEESALRAQFKSMSESLRRDFTRSERLRLSAVDSMMDEYIRVQLEWHRKEKENVWDGAVA